MMKNLTNLRKITVQINTFLRDRINKLFDNDSLDSEAIQQSPFWIRSTTWTLIGTATFGIVWLSIAETDEIIVVSGKLEPIGSVKEIQMPVGGIASEILIEDGEVVSAGQIVMQLDAEAIQKRLETLSSSIELKNEQLFLKSSELQNNLSINSEERKMLESTLDLQYQIVDRFKSLSTEGAVPELQYLEQVNRATETEGRLNQNIVNRKRLEAGENQVIQQLKVELEELKARYAEAKVNLRYQSLKSPVDGVVFDLKPRSRGYVARSTETVMKIVPFNTLQGKVEIPSNQIGFVRVGMPVDLSIDSFPATDFGALSGNVKSIGSDALAPSQTENRPEYRFPAIIKLDSQSLQLNNGNQLALQVGMSITSNIKLRKVSYLKLLLGTFEEKIDSLREF